MEGGRIRLRSEEDDLELEILEETVVQGVTYILVTDAKEGEDGVCYVMKDTSAPEDEEADFSFAEGEEAERIIDIFAELLSGEDITIER
jgi:hypothetical protein